MAETAIVHPNCPNASNPYHQCGQYCTKKISESSGWKGKKNSDPILLNAPKSFDRRIKEPKTQPKPREVPRNVSAPIEGFITKPEQNGKLHSSSEIVQFIDSEDEEDNNLLHKPEQNGKHHSSSEIVHKPEQNGKEIVQFIDSEAVEGNKALHKPEQNGKLHSSSEIFQFVDSEAVEGNKALHKPKQNGKLHSSSETAPYHDPEPVEYNKVLTDRSLSFNFSGITQKSEDSDSSDMISVISDHDPRTWVGKYNVKASISPVLEAIFSKHGDIAANCQLESLALRTYHLECVCYVVQELQTTPTINLTNAKIKEILAILRDVEAVQINIGWLRRVLNEIIEIIEPIALHRGIEAVKGSVKKDLEAQREDLAVKEKEVGDVKVRIAETEARLSKIELELSEFNEDFSMKRSKVENFDFKALLDELV